MGARRPTVTRRPRVVAMSLPWPSVVRAFAEGAAEGLWSHVVLDPEKNWSIPKADLYLIADGYREYYEPIIAELKSRFGARVGFYYNSPLLQSDMSQREIHLACKSHELLARGEIDFIVFLSRSWWKVFRHPRMYFLPHAVHVPARLRPLRPIGRRSGKNVGLFLPTTHRKNIAHQIVALKERKDVLLHTNVSWPYPELIAALQIEHRVYPWLPQRRYERVISTLDLALQVTHLEVESFCYGALDPMLYGIPTLVSKTIAENFGIGQRELIVRQPSDAEEVRAKTHALLDLDRRRLGALGRLCRSRVRAMSAENTAAIRDGLERIWAEINP